MPLVSMGHAPAERGKSRAMEAILVLLPQRLRNFFPGLAQEHGPLTQGRSVDALPLVGTPSSSNRAVRARAPAAGVGVEHLRTARRGSGAAQSPTAPHRGPSPLTCRASGGGGWMAGEDAGRRLA